MINPWGLRLGLEILEIRSKIQSKFVKNAILIETKKKQIVTEDGKAITVEVT